MSVAEYINITYITSGQYGQNKKHQQTTTLQLKISRFRNLEVNKNKCVYKVFLC